jgi:hypothetical protein
MTYKRIIRITDPAIAEAMADEAAHFGVTFRAARSGSPNEYVVEGAASRKRDIDTIAANVMDMDAQAAEVRT